MTPSTIDAMDGVEAESRTSTCCARAPGEDRFAARAWQFPVPSVHGAVVRRRRLRVDRQQIDTAQVVTRNVLPVSGQLAQIHGAMAAAMAWKNRADHSAWRGPTCRRT